MTRQTLTLRADSPAAVAEARHSFAARLASWRCANTADALVVFSELVTNAVNHAGGATSIVITHGNQTMRFEIHDATHSIPVRREAGNAHGGFGLRIVSRLSSGWGCCQTVSGKIVWSDVPCCPDRTH